MKAQEWAIDHANKVLEFLAGKGIKGLTGTVLRDELAEHIDDEIPGYCDDCPSSGDSDRAREPTASEEARMTGEDRG